jgi:outer membrane protein assembly factor BamA
VSLREAKPWRFELGAGYATEEGFRGFFTLAYDNLFGTGRSASLTTRISEKGYRGELAYREPWILGTEWQGEAIAFVEEKQEVGYLRDSYGATVTLQRELLSSLFIPEEPTDHPKSLRGGFRYRIEQFHRFQIDPDLVLDGAIRRPDDLVTSVQGFLTLELRDQPADPRTGSYHFAGLEIGSD